MKYSAWVQVGDYDDDFCLYLSHKILEEGDSSNFYSGETEIEALGRLLDDIQVGHPDFFHDVAIPQSYHHVFAVRDMLHEMVRQVHKGIMPTELYWGGNWDVTFFVKEVCPIVVKVPAMEATIISNAVKVEDTITRDGIDWLTIAYDGDYDTYKASPVALMFQGKKYTRMSHNSDTMRISYRTGIPFAMKF
jgi:hypothetical protein